MEKRWVVRKDVDEQVVTSLASALNVHPIVARLLALRNIKTYEEAKLFFRPTLDHLHDPFLMKNMDKAIDRIAKAIANNEHILIYGDYDVDGTTAVALVYEYFSTFYPNISFYIPDRYKEGYGISLAGIDYAEDNGISLIIALDCGIKAVDKIAYANQKKVDFIICDHHLPGAVIPDAVAVLDPKQHDCSYPYKELSGCGIGFKLIQAMAMSFEEVPKNIEPYLDLVAVSIAADIVPITGENRVLAYHGLHRLNTQPREGLKAIMELAGVKRELNISDIVFIIAPRINAAGRIDSGNKAVDLLLSANALSANESGIGLNSVNAERKTLDMQITQQAFEMIESNASLMNRKSTVLFHSDWHKGVVGIVASRLTEKYYRPTVVLTESNGLATGSARSVKDFDVYTAIEACSDLLEQFGGHKYAAGLTLKVENIDAFSMRFEEVVHQTIKEHMLTPEIEIDAEIDLHEINSRLYRILKQFGPFGPGNLSPVFVSKQVNDKGSARVLGDKHLKFDAVEKGTGISYSSIGFGLANHYDKINSGPFDICYSIEENEWRGNITMQLNIKDIR